MTITKKMLDDVTKKVAKSKAPVHRNKKGEPVYMLRIYGTKKEHKDLWKKLNDLND